MRRSIPAALLCLFAFAASASTPYVRSFDSVPGFNAAEVRAIAQDARGFMWFASEQGLIRFDGQQARRFAPSERPCRVLSVSVDDFGAFAHDECGQLFSVDSHEQTRLLLPAQVGRVRAAASVGADRYAVVDNQLVSLRGDALKPLGLTVVPEPFGFPRLLAVGCGVVLSTSATSWLIRNDQPGTAPTPLRSEGGAEIGDVVAAAGCDANPLALLTRFPGVLYRAESGKPARLRELHSERNRGIGLAYRGARLWAGYDIKLLGFDGDELSQTFAQSRDLPSGGPLLVDAEQSLWIGSIARVLQLPEPDAQHYDASAGLVSSHAYDVVAEPWRGADAVLALTWQGAHRLRGGRVENQRPMDLFGTACTGAQHSWYATATAWQLDSAAGSIRFSRTPGDESTISQCAQANDSDLAATELGLITHHEGQAEPIVLRRALHPENPPGISAVAVHAERLWLAHGDEVCALALQSPDQVALCQRCSGARSIRGLLSEEGKLYASAPPLGIVRIDVDGCHPQRIDIDSLGPAPNGLAQAHDPGFWAFSSQGLLRLRTSGPEQLQMLETIGRPQGLSSAAAIAVLDIGQALWVANIEGYTRISRSQFDRAERPLRLTPLRASADGLPIGNGEVLPASTRVVELSFAGLSFKAPEQLRYRHRINASAWSPASANPSITLTGVQPGAYRIEVAFQRSAAGLWSAAEVLGFSVRSPWQYTWWGISLIALAVLSLIAAAYGVRRQRLALLSRQRSEIAADLHDELGSELASVRVLSSLLERADLSDVERSALIADLQESSEAASGNLRRLVAHMKSGATIGQLLAQVKRLAERLCGSALQLQIELSELENSRALPASTYRQLYLLLSEALSNVARHAQATSVTLHATLRSGRLVLECEDDGCGFDPGSAQGNGLGHLRERARKLGATLSIRSAPSHGTSVRIEVPL